MLIGFFCVELTLWSQPRNYETNPDRKRTVNWLFGDSVWLDWTTNPPIQKKGSKMHAVESAAVFSDTSGKLILYSDGMTVWNNNHKIIVNGDSLNGNWSSSQGSMFITQPGSDSIVFLFTTDLQGNNKGFCYNKIILNANPDKIRVAEKNIKLLPSSCESISATRHANGIWTWVAVHDRSGKGMNTFLITDKGINRCGIYSEGVLDFLYDIFSCQSKSAFSNDGKIYAISALSASVVEFLSFDNSLGTFKPFWWFGISAVTPTSINFSKDNRFCYITERDYQIIRVNLFDFGNTTTIDNHNDSFFIIGARFNLYNQLMINIHDSFFLGKIDNPEIPNPKFVKKGLPLQRMATNELPNFDNSYYNSSGVNFLYILNCSSHKVQLSGQDTFNANTHQWKVKKSTASNWIGMGSAKNIFYTFTDTGNYEIQYIASRNSQTDTAIKKIIIAPKISTNFLGADTGYCVGSFPSLILKSPSGMQCVKWNNDSTTANISINGPGRYIAIVTTPSFCQMSDTIDLFEDSILLKPTIQRKGDSLLTTSKAVQYLWYRNEQLISRNQNIKIIDKGIYRLVVMGKGGCPSESDTLGVYKLSVSKFSLGPISVLPNPVTENLQINGLDIANEYLFIVTDIQGRVVKKVYTNGSSDYFLSFNDLCSGLYNITITNYVTQITIKILKQ